MGVFSNNKITWLILAGVKRMTCPPAEWVEKAKQALVFDLLDKISSIKYIDRIVISSNDGSFLASVKNKNPAIIQDFFQCENFNFYAWLVERIIKYSPSSLFYWGAGASPLITADLLDGICASIITGKNILYTNNFFSSDWAAFTPAYAALDAKGIVMDNNIAYQLWTECSIQSVYLEPSAEISFDLDTPADLLTLSLVSKAGTYLKNYLKQLNLDTNRFQRFANLLGDRKKIFVSGRIGSSLFSYLDRRCINSFRIISEERGMRTVGRLASGQVSSILGKMFETMGIDGVFSFIESFSDGAVIDSRVPFAHIRGSVSTEDRFYSDLGIPEKIKDPWVREFTKRAVNSKIPVLLGGHSLVLGGLWALVQEYGEIPAFI